MEISLIKKQSTYLQTKKSPVHLKQELRKQQNYTYFRYCLKRKRLRCGNSCEKAWFGSNKDAR